MTDNAIHNNALASLIQRAAPPVLAAIKNASARTGVDFAYLVEQAAAESNFKTGAEAKTSSATGLYQFIESTWLDMVKKHGHKYGLEKQAAQINANGTVTDPAARSDILALRKDPQTAALMAAEFASGNRQYLESHVKGHIGPTEMYFAHFMGASGATGFLNAMKENPLDVAADLFPKAARANYNVFYDRQTGTPRTLAGVYEFFDKKFGRSTPPQSLPETLPETVPPRIASTPHRAAKPDFTAQHRLQALQILADAGQSPAPSRGHESAGPRPVYAQNTHPYLQYIKQDSAYSWHRARSLPAAAQIQDPVALLMMAQLEAPGSKRAERQPNYK